MNVLRGLGEFFRLLVSRFFANYGPQNAAALTYSTLLSLVPLMTVIFAILAAFPVADRMTDIIQDFIFKNFVPTSGEVIKQSLEGFISKASNLTGPSFIVLFAVAMLMMNNIDSALNRIWGTKRARGTARKFLIYWALLTLGPVLVILSLGVTSYLVSLPFLVEAEEALGLGDSVISVTPIMISMLAFALMYIAIPNRRVRLNDALVGGLFAALLFEFAKRGFAYYVTSFPSYEAIYGAFAAVPIFLVWIYLSWMIFLLGAEVTHSLELFRFSSHGKTRGSTELDDALRVMDQLQTAQRNGVASKASVISEQLDLSPVLLEELLDHFEKQGLALRTDSGEWALAKDLRQVSLYEFYQGLEIPLPLFSMIPERDSLLRKRLDERLHSADTSLQEILGISVDELTRPAIAVKKEADDPVKGSSAAN